MPEIMLKIHLRQGRFSWSEKWWYFRSTARGLITNYPLAAASAKGLMTLRGALLAGSATIVKGTISLDDAQKDGLDVDYVPPTGLTYSGSTPAAPYQALLCVAISNGPTATNQDVYTRRWFMSGFPSGFMVGENYVFNSAFETIFASYMTYLANDGAGGKWAWKAKSKEIYSAGVPLIPANITYDGVNHRLVVALPAGQGVNFTYNAYNGQTNPVETVRISRARQRKGVTCTLNGIWHVISLTGDVLTLAKSSFVPDFTYVAYLAGGLVFPQQNIVTPVLRGSILKARSRERGGKLDIDHGRRKHVTADF